MEPCVSCIYLTYCMEYVWKSSLWISIFQRATQLTSKNTIDLQYTERGQLQCQLLLAEAYNPYMLLLLVITIVSIKAIRKLIFSIFLGFLGPGIPLGTTWFRGNWLCWWWRLWWQPDFHLDGFTGVDFNIQFAWSSEKERSWRAKVSSWLFLKYVVIELCRVWLDEKNLQIEENDNRV